MRAHIFTKENKTPQEFDCGGYECIPANFF